jgi:hypothetical protein
MAERLTAQNIDPGISDKLVGGIGLAALEPLGGERTTEPVDVIAHPAFDPTEREIVLLPPDCCPAREYPPVANSHFVPHKQALPTAACYGTVQAAILMEVARIKPCVHREKARKGSLPPPRQAERAARSRSR